MNCVSPGKKLSWYAATEQSRPAVTKRVPSGLGRRLTSTEMRRGRAMGLRLSTRHVAVSAYPGSDRAYLYVRVPGGLQSAGAILYPAEYR